MKLEEKISRAVVFMQSIPKENTQVAFSGGKDSIALYHIHKLSGMNFPIRYSNTTIDPPGTMSFIRRNYPDVEIINPKKSFYKLIEERGLPTRVGRFCCQELKENYGIGKNNIEGVRWQEGSKRSKYEPEQCDTRTWMKGAKHYYPIINFTERDVWAVINQNNLKTLPYYHAPYNWKRHGCVGCPLATKKQQIKEFQTFPRHAKAIIMAIDKNIKRNGSLLRISSDPYEVFWWWVSRKSIIEWHTSYNTLFTLSFKKEFYNIILNEKYSLLQDEKNRNL
jgi:phosphoadenosine phosphosulfate reductase